MNNFTPPQIPAAQPSAQSCADAIVANPEYAPCELKPTIMAVAQLEHRAKEVKTV